MRREREEWQSDRETEIGLRDREREERGSWEEVEKVERQREGGETEIGEGVKYCAFIG